VKALGSLPSVKSREGAPISKRGAPHLGFELRIDEMVRCKLKIGWITFLGGRTSQKRRAHLPKIESWLGFG
jgi:hypothetical protein